MPQIEIRDSDLLGRLGGEEFAVAMAVRSPDEAAAVAERLRLRVAQTALTFGKHRHRFAMTISAGVAMRQSADVTIDQVIARADAALYRAKDAGRNRVIGDQLAGRLSRGGGAPCRARPARSPARPSTLAPAPD